MYYQGPVTNPGQEVMMAVGGRILSRPERPAEDILEEVTMHKQMDQATGNVERVIIFKEATDEIR